LTLLTLDCQFRAWSLNNNHIEPPCQSRNCQNYGVIYG